MKFSFNVVLLVCSACASAAPALQNYARENNLRELQNAQIGICTDSQAALKALTSHKVTSRLVWECREALNELAEQNKLTLMWVPGHCGVEGNEEADELAKQGSSTPYIGSEPALGITKTMESFDSLEPLGRSYRPPHFTQPIYKATIVNNKISYMDSPISMENANDGMYFVITSDNYEDYSITVIDSNSTNERQIELHLITTNPIIRDFDVIILEALDEELVPVSRTTVLLFNSNMEFNMYRMTFKVDNEEYIILNFFYFKWFLGLLTVTGLLILAIEVHEIIKNMVTRRESGKYSKLQSI